MKKAKRHTCILSKEWNSDTETIWCDIRKCLMSFCIVTAQSTRCSTCDFVAIGEHVLEHHDVLYLHKIWFVYSMYVCIIITISCFMALHPWPTGRSFVHQRLRRCWQGLVLWDTWHNECFMVDGERRGDLHGMNMCKYLRFISQSYIYIIPKIWNDISLHS